MVKTNEKESLVELSIPPKPEFLRIVRLFVSGYASRLSITIDLIEDLKVAVSEACNNAIQSAEETGINEPVKIRCWCDASNIFFEITDKVQGTPAAKPFVAEDFNERGLGFVLIQTLMDDVTLRSSRTGGGRVLMRKEII